MMDTVPGMKNIIIDLDNWMVIMKLPRALNFVKNVADFKLISGNMMMIRNKGTVLNWPQIFSNSESVPLLLLLVEML